MNEQPEALRLAERLVGMEASSNDQYEAAAELRRLHEENERLRDAVAAEREACAKVCEKMADNIYSNSHEDSQPMPHAVAKFCAAAIRARGER
jgi:DNA-binding ferritin-like protein